ncbi:MAG: hypothetical protein KAG91_00120 [Mycoplasmataceae bacterium]|nr:hypothetical protein [Mycoplasmataceae bacterium]
MESRNFVFSTLSASLLEKIDGTPTRVRLFNFADRKHTFSLSAKSPGKARIGAFDTTWVRIYDDKNKYYDFITTNVFFVSNKEGLMIMCEEDTKMLDAQFFAKEIEKFLADQKIENMSGDEYIEAFVKKANLELKEAFKELSKYYSLEKQVALGRMDIDDLFVQTKNDLTKKYLRDLILKSVIKENRIDILNLISK